MKATAIVIGAKGRIGRALTLRLTADGYCTIPIDRADANTSVDLPNLPIYLFECSYDPGNIAAHLESALMAMKNWRKHAGIFVPSSYWIGTDTPYGRSKLVIEQAAKFYNGLGAKIVTDRIGYFPGDGVEPDPRDPFIDKLVSGDELYARIMEKML